jgi:hypothetical protein
MKSPGLARSFNTAALFSLLAVLAVGCQKEEAPPPLPQAKPAEVPTVATIIPEDEETEEEAVTTDEPKKTGKGGGTSSLGKCCAALRQNAVNAPPETKVQMEQAAAACEAANKAGASSALSVIRRFGVALPPICQ